MNLLFIDTETTGFSPRKHEIIELAAAIEINGVTQCEFTLYFRPEKWENIRKEALAVNGYTKEKLENLPWKKEQIYFLQQILFSGLSPGDKFRVVEHSLNGNFDIEFLKELLKICAKKFDSVCYRKSINTRDLVKKRFPREKNLTLKDCARLLGIPFDDSKHHGALYDMQVMRKIYHKCKGDKNA